MARHVCGRDPVPVWAALSMLIFSLAALFGEALSSPWDVWVRWALAAVGVGCLVRMCVLAWQERKAQARNRRGGRRQSGNAYGGGVKP